jgi:hypothetical protein
MTRFLTGVLAGTVATVPMTAFWEFMHPRLAGEPPRPLPPREVAEALAVKAGVNRHLSERDIEDLALAAHFGYGALAGGVFGMVFPRNGGNSAPAAVAFGLLFGAGVWTVSYFGWLPATGVRHSPRYDVPARTRLIFASHLVWGSAAGLVLRAAGRRRRPASGA